MRSASELRQRWLLRWGPGWWLEHPAGLGDEQRAIAMQLLSVEAADHRRA
jgi:hypothetical protein